MLTQTDSNLKVTQDEAARKEAFDNKIAYLQLEASKASEVLRTLKNDSQRISKDNAYHDDLLTKKIQQLKETTDKVNILNEEFNRVSSELSKIKEESVKITKEQTAKTMELKDREDAVEKQEQEVAQRLTSISQRESKHEDEKDVFLQKVSQLKEVTSIF